MFAVEWFKSPNPARSIALMSYPLRQYGLIVTAAWHLVAGVALAWLIDTGTDLPITNALLDALVYADAGLLALWVGLGRHSKLKGFVGVGFGMAFLAALVAWALRHGMSGLAGPGNDFWTTVWLWLFQLALALFAMAVVLAALLGLRRHGAALTRLTPAQASAETAEIQFSLRQLMLLVFFVAALVRLGPLVREHLNDYRSYVSSLLAISIGGACLGATTLLAMWAVLGRRTTLWRPLVALLLAGSFGLLPPYYFPALFSDDLVASVAVFAAAEAITIGSLLVVRWSGYRMAMVLGSKPSGNGAQVGGG